MFNRHKHIYTDVNIEYVPRSGRELEFKGGLMSVEVMEMMLDFAYGYTFIHQRCSCGKIRTLKERGHYNPAEASDAEQQRRAALQDTRDERRHPDDGPLGWP